MKLDVIARIIGSSLVIISYFTILHISASLGAMMMFVADAISVPYFIRTKSWMSFSCVLSLHIIQ